MRKIFFIFIFTNVFLTTFTKNITFNFNTPTGKVQYFKAGDLNVQSNYFYEGTLTLDLEETEYHFLIINEDFPIIEKIYNIKDITTPINIVFSKKDYVVVQGKITNNSSNLGNVVISFTNAENKSFNFITDIFGQYTAYLPPGNYLINAKRFGYTLEKINKIVHTFSFTNNPYSLNLELKELPSFIQGKVIDENGFAIPYPTLFIKNGKDIIEKQGDEFGMFKLEVDSGIVTILAQKHSFFQNGVVRKVEKNSSISNIEIPLKKIRYSITGTITNGIKALPNIQLQLLTEDNNKITTTYSNENGYFEFYKIPGNREVFISILDEGKVIMKTPIIELTKDIKDYNILIDK